MSLFADAVAGFARPFTSAEGRDDRREATMSPFRRAFRWTRLDGRKLPQFRRRTVHLVAYTAQGSTLQASLATLHPLGQADAGARITSSTGLRPCAKSLPLDRG